ncbi:MAG: YihY/virulence factor BrkB family protein [Halobacteriales archaeon]
MIEAGRAVAAVVREAEVTFLAAAIAYYALVSTLPAILLAVAVASTLGGEPLVETVLAQSEEFLTPEGRTALGSALTGARGRSGATVVGIAVLLWSALRLFRGVDVAFSQVYGTTHVDSFLDGIRDALLVLVSVGLGLGVMVGVGGAIVTVSPAGGDALALLLLLAGLSIVFFPLYYVFPDTDVRVREALPGTITTALGWVLLQAGFQVYAAGAAQFQVYGVIGGILLLVTWFYVAAVLLLVGAAVNCVLAER